MGGRTSTALYSRSLMRCCMPMVPSGFVHQSQLDAEIKNAIGKLGPEAVHVAYNLGADSTGEPSVFFRIVLAEKCGQSRTGDFTPVSTFAASPNSDDGMIPSGIRWHTNFTGSSASYLQARSKPPGGSSNTWQATRKMTRRTRSRNRSVISKRQRKSSEGNAFLSKTYYVTSACEEAFRFVRVFGS